MVGALSVIVIRLGNGIDDMSSSPIGGCYCFTLY